LILVLDLIVTAWFPAPKDMDPSRWVSVTVYDTIHAPIRAVWDGEGHLGLQQTNGGRRYKDLPVIVKTDNRRGSFSQAGDFRIVYFSSGDTVVETILYKRAPDTFAYELTKALLPMKRVATRARGVFVFTALNDSVTVKKWTYSFEQKNFIGKLLIQRYISRTHRAWMQDMMSSSKREVEKEYARQRESDR
jgi:hypothetical protein